MARVAPAVICAGSVLLVAARGLGGPTAQLSYARAEGAESCPGKTEVRRAVSERLGYDPVDENSPQIIAAIVEKTEAGFRARVELISGGQSQGLRELRSEGTCAELVSAMALSMSIAIDPERAERGPTPSSPHPAAQAAFAPEAPKAPVSEAKTPSVLPAPPPIAPLPRALRAGSSNSSESLDDARLETRQQRLKLPIDYSVGAFVEVASGFTPGTAAGGALRVRGRHGLFSLSLEGRLDAPSGFEPSEGGQVHAGIAALVLAPCLHFRWAFGCALGTGGEVWAASSAVTDPRNDVALYSAIGARLGLDWPETGVWAASLYADGLHPLTPISIRLNGREAWASPSLALTFGAGAVVRF